MGVPLHFANVLVDPPRREVRREERGPTSGGAAPVMRCLLLAVAVRACALRCAGRNLLAMGCTRAEAFSDFSPTLMTYMI